MRTKRPPLILLDLGLPPSPRRGEEELRALGEILAFDREAKVIVVTGNQDREYALKGIGQGAFDYYLKPAEIEELKTVLKRALHIASLEKENAGKDHPPGMPVFDEIIGENPSIQSIFELVRKVSATDVAVLIQGESGSGDGRRYPSKGASSLPRTRTSRKKSGRTDSGKTSIIVWELSP